jgi:hypothetical protein
MTGIHKISSHVIDYAERMSAMADAAQGRRQPRGKLTRWLLLPASGAALYAFVRSESFSRGAKGVVDEAKTRASELPEDLVARVRDTTKETSSSRNGGSSITSSGRKSSSTRRRTSSSRSRSGSTRRKTTASR